MGPIWQLHRPPNLQVNRQQAYGDNESKKKKIPLQGAQRETWHVRQGLNVTREEGKQLMVGKKISAPSHKAVHLGGKENYRISVYTVGLT